MTLKEELEIVEGELELLKVQQKELEDKQRDVYRRSLEAAEEDKVAKDSLCALLVDEGFPRREMQYPIQVEGIAWSDGIPPVWDRHFDNPGAWVCVRPCGDEYENKTYLGVMLGRLALTVTASHNKDTGLLHLSHGHHNPAIYVPDLKKVIFGMGSWWGVIESPEDLKKISDADIENVWYVRAMKEITGDG